MKKKLLFLFSTMFLMLFTFTARAADPEGDTEYEAAIAALGDGGTYFITTDVSGVKYYVTAAGTLTSTRADGCIFTLTKTDGGALKTYGYYIDGGGKRFTNSPMSNNAAVLNVANFSTTTNNRKTWEAQVLFLKDELYAIRSCNTAYGESSWEDCGRTYWTWKVEEAAAIPQYTYEPTYQWKFEAVTPINVSYQLAEADGTAVGDPVVVKQEANSEVAIPASFTSVFFYNYAVEGTIGDSDCTITVKRTMKTGVVHALTDLSNAKAYTMRCDRGAMLSNGSAMVSTAKFAGEPGQFAVVYYDETDDETNNGSYYLYSVADKQFVTNNGALAAMPTHGTEDAIKLDAKTDPYFLGYFTIGGTNNGLNTNGSGDYGYVINTWMNADQGNQYYFIEAADFDAADALKALNDFFHPSYFVTYVVKDAEGNVLFTSEPAPAVPGQNITTLPDDFKKGFTTYNEVDVTITDPETTVEFTATPNFPFAVATSFADATWYNMTIRSDYWVAMDETEPYYPKSDKDLDADASKWAFGGDAYKGIFLYNRAAGDGKTLARDGDMAVMRDGDFRWEIFANGDGFVLRPTTGDDRENMWINQSGGSEGPLKFWNSANGKTDNGSTFRIKEATPVYAITIADAENGTVVADKAESKAGEKIRLTITPAEGYELDELTVLAANGEVVEVSKSYTFDMPAAKVNVTATFKEATEKPVIYIETDLTAQFSALTDVKKWIGATGYTATNFCPAVTTNAGETIQVCEKYEGNCNSTGDVFYQTLTGLAPGVYNIELYGGAAYTFGRGFTSEAFTGDSWNAGDKITENTGVTLYAITSEGEFGGEIPIYYATNFPEGAAVVNLNDVVVGENGELKIGMSKTSKATNWHVIQLKGVTAKVVAADLLATTVANAKAIDSSLLTQALAQKISDTIDEYNGTYETADEYKKAIAAIEAVIEEANIYMVAAPKLAAMKELVDATNFYTEEALNTYYTVPAQKLAEGTLTMNEANALQNPSVITGWHADITVDNFLLSVWDTNADFQDAVYYINSWSVEGETDGTEFKVPFFEYWTGDANSLGEKTLTATFEGLEAGKTALVNIWVRVRAKNGTDAAEATGITLQVNDGEAVDVTEGETNGQFNLAKYSAYGVVGEDGKLEVKLIVAADNNISWLSFKNAKYEIIDAEQLDYALALNSIEDGATYSITTMVGETKYYLTDGGELTSDIDKAGVFAFNKVKGEAYEYGFKLYEKCFTNPDLNGDEAVLNSGHIRNNTQSTPRDNWEAQVFFLKDGKYAVRATNAPGGDSSWALVAKAFWTVNEGADGPVAEYSFDVNYVWELEKVTTVKVTYALYDADGEEPVQSVVVTQKFNSEVVIPSAFTSVAFYDYVAEGTIGTEDCTIKVTRTYKPGLIFNLDDLSNSKAYTITCDRGAMLTNGETIASTSSTDYASADPGQFAIISYEDNYYLYSVADKKFVTNSGTLSDVPVNGVADAIKMDPKTAPYFMYYFTVAEGTNYGVNMNGSGNLGGIVINNWMTADAGNQYYMIEAADFDPTAALAMLEKGAYLVPLQEALAANEPNPVLAGDGVFQKPQAAYDTYKAVYDAQKAVADNTASTIEQLQAALVALNDAIEIYDAVEINKPDPEKFYMFQHKTSEGYLGFNDENELFVLAEPDPFSWDEVEGGYNINSGLSFIAVDGSKLIGSADSPVLIYATPVAAEDGNVYYNIVTDVEGRERAITGSTVGKKATLVGVSSAGEKSQWTIVEYENLPMVVEVPVTRYTGMGYGVTEATVDLTEAKAYLGVEELTADMLTIVNPDGTEVAATSTDGWFNADGVATGWAPDGDSKINVKFFQAIPDGKFTICDMNGADEIGKSYTTTWALSANDKDVLFVITVTFAEAPVKYLADYTKKGEVQVNINVPAEYSAYAELQSDEFAEAEVSALIGDAWAGIFGVGAKVDGQATLTDTYSCDPAPGFWCLADGTADVWANGTFGVSMIFSEDYSTFHFSAFLKEANTEALSTTFYLVNEETKEYVAYVITVNAYDSIRDMQLDGKAEIYDLSGRKVSKIQRGGIYIVNGKRVAVK
jgi:hypothetical protein